MNTSLRRCFNWPRQVFLSAYDLVLTSMITAYRIIVSWFRGLLSLAYRCTFGAVFACLKTAACCLLIVVCTTGTLILRCHRRASKHGRRVLHLVAKAGDGFRSEVGRKLGVCTDACTSMLLRGRALLSFVYSDYIRPTAVSLLFSSLVLCIAGSLCFLATLAWECYQGRSDIAGQRALIAVDYFLFGLDVVYLTLAGIAAMAGRLIVACSHMTLSWAFTSASWASWACVEGFNALVDSLRLLYALLSVACFAAAEMAQSAALHAYSLSCHACLAVTRGCKLARPHIEYALTVAFRSSVEAAELSFVAVKDVYAWTRVSACWAAEKAAETAVEGATTGYHLACTCADVTAKYAVVLAKASARLAVYAATDGRRALFQHLDDIYTGTSSYRELGYESLLSLRDLCATFGVYAFHTWFQLTTDLGEQICRAFLWSCDTSVQIGYFTYDLSVKTMAGSVVFYEASKEQTLSVLNQASQTSLQIYSSVHGFATGELRSAVVEVYAAMSNVYTVMEDNGGKVFSTGVQLSSFLYAWTSWSVGIVAHFLHSTVNRFVVHYFLKVALIVIDRCIALTGILATFLTDLSAVTSRAMLHLLGNLFTVALSLSYVVSIACRSLVLATKLLFTCVAWTFHYIFIRFYSQMIYLYSRYQTQIFLTFILAIVLGFKTLVNSTPLITDDYDGDFDFSSSDGESSEERDEEEEDVEEDEEEEDVEEEWKHEVWEEEHIIKDVPFNANCHLEKFDKNRGTFKSLSHDLYDGSLDGGSGDGIGFTTRRMLAIKRKQEGDNNDDNGRSAGVSKRSMRITQARRNKSNEDPRATKRGVLRQVDANALTNHPPHSTTTAMRLKKTVDPVQGEGQSPSSSSKRTSVPASTAPSGAQVRRRSGIPDVKDTRAAGTTNGGPATHRHSGYELSTVAGQSRSIGRSSVPAATTTTTMTSRSAAYKAKQLANSQATSRGTWGGGAGGQLTSDRTPNYKSTTTTTTSSGGGRAASGVKKAGRGERKPSPSSFAAAVAVDWTSDYSSNDDDSDDDEFTLDAVEMPDAFSSSSDED